MIEDVGAVVVMPLIPVFWISESEVSLVYRVNFKGEGGAKIITPTSLPASE